MKKKIQSFAVLGVLLGLCSCSGKPAAKSQAAPKVQVAFSKKESIPIVVDAVGHFTPFNTVNIQAQVEGRLLELHFTEGQMVNKGDMLFTVDPRPYEADLDQAVAQRAENIANLSYAAEKVARYEGLVPENYVSVLNYKEYQTNLAVYEAAVMKNDAEIRKAEINLDYCYIRAPFSGRTGKRLVDEGNLVTNDGSNLLVVNQMDPIFVDFSIPERDFQKLMTYQNQKNLKVEVSYPDHPELKYEGDLVLVDNFINQKTGMIPLRGQLKNPNQELWPGQFVRIKVVLYEEEDAIMVPETALNIGQHGRYVYVVNRSGEAEYRAVKVGEHVGSMVSIVDGINEGEALITNGQINVKPQTKVDVVSENPEVKAFFAKKPKVNKQKK